MPPPSNWVLPESRQGLVVVFRVLCFRPISVQGLPEVMAWVFPIRLETAQGHGLSLPH